MISLIFVKSQRERDQSKEGFLKLISRIFTFVASFSYKSVKDRYYWPMNKRKSYIDWVFGLGLETGQKLLRCEDCMDVTTFLLCLILRLLSAALYSELGHGVVQLLEVSRSRQLVKHIPGCWALNTIGRHTLQNWTSCWVKFSKYQCGLAVHGRVEEW